MKPHIIPTVFMMMMMMMLPNPIMTTPTMLCKCMIIVMVMMSQRSKQRKPCHPQQTTTTKLPLTSQTTHHGKNSKDNIDNFPLYMIPKHFITLKQKKNKAHDK